MRFPQTRAEYDAYRSELEARGFTVLTKWRKGLKAIRLGDIVLSEEPAAKESDVGLWLPDEHEEDDIEGECLCWDAALAVARYFELRRAQHEADRNAVMSALTKREQALIREAAVIGYVQGVRAAGTGRDHDIPPDGQILASVLDGCLAMSDLYPAIRRACRRGLKKAGDPS